MKSKRIITILLSLAIMLTFMPAMAFATDLGPYRISEWGAKGASVTDVERNTFETTRTYSDGVVTATGKDKAVSGGNKIVAPIDIYGRNYTEFYDLDAFVLTYSYGANAEVIDGTSDWTTASFDAALTNASGELADPTGFYIVAAKPAYLSEYDAEHPYKAATALAQGQAYRVIGNSNGTYTANIDDLYTITVKGLDKFDKTSDEIQTLNLTTEIAAVGTPYIPTEGSLENTKATVTINPNAKGWQNISFYKEEAVKDNKITGYTQVSTNNFTKSISFPYTGANHAILNDTVSGYDVTWTVRNKATGKYDPMTLFPEVKNVGDSQSIRATITHQETRTYPGGQMVWTVTDATYTFDVSVSPAGTDYWQFGFVVTNETEGEYADYFSAVYHVAGTEYNALDWIDVVADPLTKDDAHAAAKKVAAAAVAANKSELMNFFSDYFDIDTKIWKGDPNRVNLSISKKTLSSDEKKVLDEKYAALIANFGIDTSGDMKAIYYGTNGEVIDDALVLLNSDIIDEEIEFTKAPSKVTYKGSKTTKAGKLKKNQTITVKAKSNKGRTVNYKLVNVNTSKFKINKTTGKITVKKGLAKGTYKIKVKAYVPGQSAGDAQGLYEYQTIKIIVKK